MIIINRTVIIIMFESILTEQAVTKIYRPGNIFVTLIILVCIDPTPPTAVPSLPTSSLRQPCTERVSISVTMP